MISASQTILYRVALLGSFNYITPGSKNIQEFFEKYRMLIFHQISMLNLRSFEDHLMAE